MRRSKRDLTGWLRGGSASLLALILSTSVAADDAEHHYAFADAEEIAVVAQTLRQGQPVRFRSVGNTGLVLQVLLEGEVMAAYKPLAEPRVSGFEAELAASRLARRLHIDNVPIAFARELERDAMKSRFVRGGRSSWSRADRAIDWSDEEPRRTRGAIIHWIRDLEDLPLERDEARAAYFAALKIDGEGAEVPKGSPPPQDFSTMLLFDFLIGNWDRFSGGNTKMTQESEPRLCIRDHDIAFAAPLPARLLERVRGRLSAAERFSRSVVEALTQLERPALEAALQGDGAQAIELSRPQLDELWERRAEALSYIGALIAEHGEDVVLAWP